METAVFAWEKLQKGVRIWRCYSWDTQVEIPETLAGLPVTELAPYAFSDHMDREMLRELALSGRLQLETGEAAEVWLREEAASGGTGADPSERNFSFPDDLPPELCGPRMEALSLPSSVEKIGRYAFYNCSGLQKIAFSSRTADLGSGLFTGCHHVEALTVRMAEDAPFGFQAMMAELAEELRVDYYEGGQYCRLIFPEYYEEGGENTPARNTIVTVHGSGLKIRNCFKEKRFQFAWYDDCFDHICALERQELAVEVAVERLLHPYGLTPRGANRYREYLSCHLPEAGRWILEKKDGKVLRWFLEEALEGTAPVEQTKGRQLQESLPVTRELLDQLAKDAGNLQKPEAVSYLMDLRHRRFPARAKKFDL